MSPLSRNGQAHSYAVRGVTGGGTWGASVRRPWASHEDGQHNEMIDTVDAIFIHSADLASSVSMQWSHDEIVSAIVMFRICRQLLGVKPQDPHRGSASGPRWGIYVPQAPGSTVKLQVVV